MLPHIRRFNAAMVCTATVICCGLSIPVFAQGLNYTLDNQQGFIRSRPITDVSLATATDPTQAFLQKYRSVSDAVKKRALLTEFLPANLRKNSNVRNQKYFPAESLIAAGIDLDGQLTILELQKRDFKANDIRLVNTLLSIANEYAKIKNYDRAVQIYQQAQHIQNYYSRNSPENKQIDLQIDHYLKLSGKNTSSNLTTYSSARETIENTNWTQDRRPGNPQTGVELSKLKETYNQYLEEAKVCPYSPRASYLLSLITPTLLAQQDYDRVVDMLRAQIEIYARTPNYTNTGHTSAQQPVDAMLVCYDNLAATLKVLGRDAEAKALIAEARSFLPAQADCAYTLALAKIAISAGDRAAAYKNIEELKKLPPVNTTPLQKSFEIYHLYNALGDKEEAQKYIPPFNGAPLH